MKEGKIVLIAKCYVRTTVESDSSLIFEQKITPKTQAMHTTDTDTNNTSQLCTYIHTYVPQREETRDMTTFVRRRRVRTHRHVLDSEQTNGQTNRQTDNNYNYFNRQKISAADSNMVLNQYLASQCLAKQSVFPLHCQCLYVDKRGLAYALKKVQIFYFQKGWLLRIEDAANY